MASEKDLKKWLETLHQIVSEEDGNFSAAQAFDDEKVQKISEAVLNTNGGFFFEPPLQLHPRDGRPITPIKGWPLTKANWTADTQIKFLRAYQAALSKMKAGERFEQNFSEEILQEFKGDNITDFYEKHAHALVKDEALRSKHAQAIGTLLGMSPSSRSLFGWAAHDVPDKCRGLAGAHYEAKELQKMETREEATPQQDFVAQMTASAKNAVEELIDMAAVLEETAVSMGGKVSENHPQVLRFVDDLPIAVGFFAES